MPDASKTAALSWDVLAPTTVATSWDKELFSASDTEAAGGQVESVM